ncbi:MAG: hypothetical protein R3344_04520 [Acidobacteriota bacterium]|nr:hypothetical protein [Acidobacteriota bacterium]
MNRTIRHRRLRELFRIAAVVTVAIALAAPVLAHDRRHARGHGHDPHRSASRHRVHTTVDIDRGRFVVPVRIEDRHVASYRPYFWTRLYDPAHRHHHAVYRFPVHTSFGVVYEPYVYCEGRWFPDGLRISYHGRHVAFSVDF